MKIALVIAILLPAVTSCTTMLNKSTLAEESGARENFADDVDIGSSYGDFSDRYVNEHKIKSIGILSVHTMVHGQGLTASRGKTTTKVSFSPTNFQSMVNRVHDHVQQNLEKQGLKVVSTKDLAKFKEYRSSGSDNSKADSNWVSNIHATSAGGNYFDPFLLIQDDEYLDALAKKAKVDAFVLVDANLIADLDGADTVDGVDGQHIRFELANRTVIYVPHFRFEAAGGRSGFVDVNDAAVMSSDSFKFVDFFPTNFDSDDSKSQSLNGKAWSRLSDEMAEIYELQMKKFTDDQKIF